MLQKTQQQNLSPLSCTQETNTENLQLLTNLVTNSSLSNNILTSLINKKNANKFLEKTDLNVNNINNDNDNKNVITSSTINNVVDNVDKELQKQQTIDTILANKLTTTSETLIPEICLSYSQVNFYFYFNNFYF